MKQTTRRQLAILVLSVLALTPIAPWVFGQDLDPLLTGLRRQAEQGNASAQLNLGLRHKNGEGVPQDYIQAHKWVNLAVSRTTGEVAERSD